MVADNKGYYAILGVSEKASHLEIKKPYRNLARKYHPDKNNAAHAEEMIKKINAAYEILSDFHKRKQYDTSSFGDVSGPEQEAYMEQEEQHVEEEYADGAERAEQQPRAKKVDAKDTTDYYLGGNTYIETPKSRFHIIVEPSLCMAYGSCETLAPRVFVLEKDKLMNPKAIIQSETGEDFDTILAAAETCPTKAIKIIDRHTGDQIYP